MNKIFLNPTDSWERKKNISWKNTYLVRSTTDRQTDRQSQGETDRLKQTILSHTHRTKAENKTGRESTRATNPMARRESTHLHHVVE